MHAYLVTGKSRQDRLAQAEKLLKKLGVKDILKLTVGPSGKHLVSDIREVRRQLFLKSRDPKGRGLLIEEANLLTEEAANAFLKVLEEPPGKTVIILTSPSRDHVLQTISSRTSHLDLGPEEINLGEEGKETIKLFEFLTKASLGERFKFTESLTDRQQAQNFVIGQILAAREALFNQINNGKSAVHLIELLENLNQTYQDLESNVNVKLTISNLLLHYPKYPTKYPTSEVE